MGIHLTVSCASSPDSSLSKKSFPALTNHLRFGLPLLLFPRSPSSSLFCPHNLLLFSMHSQCMPIPLQPTFLQFLGDFFCFRCLYTSFCPALVTLHSYIVTSSSSSIVLSSLPISRHRTSHSLSYNHLVHFPLDLQAYSSVTQIPRYPRTVVRIPIVF